MSEQGFEHLRAGQYEDAIEAFSACLVMDPRCSRVLQARAMASFKIKRWEASQADYEAAKAIDPEDSENWIGVGLSLAMRHQIYPALATFEGYLKKHPHHVRANIQIGMLHFKLGAINKGREHMQLALKSRPSKEERAFIEASLSQQEKLDIKRHYRPDFEALRKQNQMTEEASWVKAIKKFFKKG